ncbi:MAG: peptidoglycan editing factor PgeF [Candidatus Omnitrophota bacterium]
MLKLSKYLGEGVEAWFTETDVNPFLPQEGDIFDDHVSANLKLQGISADKIFNIRQVHGGAVLNCDRKEFHARAEDIPSADGAVTSLSGVFLAVRTADCLPVFLYDENRKVIALIHAGWRSTRERICTVAVRRMVESYSSNPRDIKAVFGPSIHQCCYEVGQDMCMIFPEAMSPRWGKWFLNLQQVNRDHLISSGIKEENLVDLNLCTYCNPSFFSYRRQGKEAGRHLSLLRLI